MEKNSKTYTIDTTTYRSNSQKSIISVSSTPKVKKGGGCKSCAEKKAIIKGIVNLVNESNSSTSESSSKVSSLFSSKSKLVSSPSEPFKSSKVKEKVTRKSIKTKQIIILLELFLNNTIGFLIFMTFLVSMCLNLIEKCSKI